ncbi:MAG: CotH kinase family protein [Limisphaerales bacterium]
MSWCVRLCGPFEFLRGLFVVLILALVASPSSGGGDLVLSEFLASNGGSLLDEDGDPSDWIELHNTSALPVSTKGWSLTDDPTRESRWVLPDRTIEPGGFLLVFASGKNRSPADPGRPHTDFRLNASGEYLALIEPDGSTVASEFEPAFPPQDADISYGIPSTPGHASLLGDTTVSVLVPSSAADLPGDWTTGGTSTSRAWTSTRGFPLGFDFTPANPGGSTNLALAGTATQSTTGYNLGAGNANDGDLNTFSHTATQDDGSTWRLDLGAVYEIRRVVLHNRAECCQTRLRDITVSLLAADGRTVLWTSDLLNPENALNSPASITLDLLDLDVEPVPARFVQVTRAPDHDLSGSGGAGNADEDSVLSLGEVEVFGVDSLSYAPLLRTDLTETVHGKSGSVFARIPFVLADPIAASAVNLRLRYDDGVVVYLNGQEIVSRNAVGRAWDSIAAGERSKAEGLVSEGIDLMPMSHVLRQGTNWLAFHLLNAAAADPDLLLDADLVGEAQGPVFSAYLERPTPGASNNVPWFLGRVADTDFGVSRGFVEAPFDLTITSATPGAEIRYTLDGSLPTELHGSIYSGPLRIERTTVVRAAAFKRDFRPTNVDTHTYVLLDSTIAQAANPPGFPTTWAGLAPDYAMDTRITRSAAYASRMQESLRSLPTLSMVTDVDNLFGPSRGIYANPERSGLSWERPVSMEWIEPEGSRVFQVDAGLRIQGGYFRSRNATHKHSLRLLFKDEYGPGRLRGDLFDVFGATREFDTLVLRAGANDGYAWDAARDTEQFLRDEFGRRLHLAMGQVSPHGRFVHVYLNGLYWGLYNLTERPAEDFSASYFGGAPEQWDAVNSGEVKNGSLTDWNAFIARVRTTANLSDYQRLKGLSPDGSPHPTAPAYLDAINYIDYMLLNIWGGNWDWPNKNFWFGRDRTGASGGFKFYLWDFENTMGNNRARSPLEMVSPRSGITGSWVAEPHERLRQLEEYRLEFADRVHRHFFNGGVLAASSLVAHYDRLAREIEPAIIAETARWGDDHHSPPQDLTDWVRERDWLLGTYLARRTDVVLDQFRASGLYPRIAAPAFVPDGGTVAVGAPVSLRTVGASELFYTTNGLDPRLPGGAIRPEAVRVVLQDPGPSASPDFIRSGKVWRYLADGSNPGSAWKENGFTDGTWPEGPSPLGYGDGDEATVVPYVDADATAQGVQKNATTFFRASFVVADTTPFTGLRLTLTYDDAAAVYLNGTEILRTDNLPAAAGASTYAAGTSADDAVITRDNLPVQLLRNGANVVAVEIHQADGGSSDISFNLELVGLESAGTGVQVSGPVFMAGPTRLMARARRSGEWSALNEALYLPGAAAPAPGDLVVSQFCFRPPDPAVAAEIQVSTDRDDFEFIELLNVSDSVLDLAGVRIGGGVSFVFPAGETLPPGQRVLVVRSRAAFAARHGALSAVIAGEYQGRLANDSDSIEVRDPTGRLLVAFTYADRSPWPASPNTGYALVLVRPERKPDPSDPANWRASVLPGGTPGRSDATRFQGVAGADANGNGQPDLIDYALGIQALPFPDAGIGVAWEDEVSSDGIHRHLVVSHPRNLAADDAPVRLEIADQLDGPWVEGTRRLVLVGDTRIAQSIARLVYRSREPVHARSNAFVRISVGSP